MNCAFADTSFYVALVNDDDVFYDAAREWLWDWRGQVLTTEYVLCEIGNAFAKAREKPLFMYLMDTLLRNPATRIVPATSELLNAGYELFKRRLDKDWSLTDCISFVVMQREGVTEALTTDKHFVEAGFKKLLE